MAKAREQLSFKIVTDVLDLEFIGEIGDSLGDRGEIHVAPEKGMRKGMQFMHGPFEIVITLASAGAFTALYKTICKYLERNKDRELTFVKGDKKITIKGHGFPEERALTRELLPGASKEK